MPSVLTASAPVLQGRGKELEAIDRQVAEVRDGRSATVVVTGAAGSGKTRLLHEAVRRAERAGLRVHVAGADPALARVPLAPLLDAMLHGDPPLLEVAGVRLRDARPDASRRMLELISRRLDEIAEDAPILVALDDVQWADDATQLAARALPRRLKGRRILWLLAVRTGSALYPVEFPDAHRIEAGPLEGAAAEALASDLLGARPGPELLDVLARAAGRPFLIVDLLRGLLEEDAVEVREGRANLRSYRLPARLRDGVSRQLERLSPVARELVRMASVLGRHFGADELAALVERPPRTLVGPLGEALDAELLCADGGDLTFRHELVREAAAASLPESLALTLRRRAMTVMTALGVPATEIAVPAVRLAETGDEEAVDVLRRAAAEVATTAPGEAAALLRRVLAVTPGRAPRRVAVVTEALPILCAAGQQREARHLADELLSEQLRPSDEAEIRLVVARMSLAHSPLEALRQCSLALSLPGLPSRTRLHLRVTRSMAWVAQGDWEAVRDAMHENLADSRAASDRVAEATALFTCAAIAVRAHRHATGVEDAGRARALARGSAEPTDGLLPGMSAAWLEYHVGHAAEAHSGEASTEPPQVGRSAPDPVWRQIGRATAALAGGNLLEARRAASEDLGDQEPGSAPAAAADYILARVALHTGDRDALARATTAAEAMREDAAIAQRRQGQWLGALLADAEGAQRRARSHLSETLAVLGNLTPTLALAPDPMDLIVLLRLVLRCADRAGAVTVVAEAERRAGLDGSLPLAGYIATHARALLERRPETLSASADSVDVVPGPVARAAILEDAAGALAASDRDRAVILLGDALSQYTTAGAERDAARVRRSLRELGVRGHRPVTADPGWRGLTGAELAVARVVASGATNREAAERLYVSRHTVTAHLRHVFVKLGISSRVELAALLSAEDA